MKGIFLALRRFLRPLEETVGDIYFFKEDIALRFNGVGKFWRCTKGPKLVLSMKNFFGALNVVP